MAFIAQQQYSFGEMCCLFWISEKPEQEPVYRIEHICGCNTRVHGILCSLGVRRFWCKFKMHVNCRHSCAHDPIVITSAGSNEFTFVRRTHYYNRRVSICSISGVITLFPFIDWKNFSSNGSARIAINLMHAIMRNALVLCVMTIYSMLV